jgi:hypothetical protein
VNATRGLWGSRCVSGRSGGDHLGPSEFRMTVCPRKSSLGCFRDPFAKVGSLRPVLTRSSFSLTLLV